MRIAYDLHGSSPAVGARLSSATLHIHRAECPERAAVEHFIASGFERHFGARVGQFTPVLASLRCGERILAAAGYRLAVDTLFLESYLPQPIDACLAAGQGRPVARDSIAEVGQLATRAPRHLHTLMKLLAEHLALAGVDWVAITATATLRQMFARFGLQWQEIAPADPIRAGISLNDWGRYYEHDPRVIAGRLSRNLGPLVAATTIQVAR
ncbi:MAG: thermostable hemolysin [Burkholderiaceae bacterium]